MPASQNPSVAPTRRSIKPVWFLQKPSEARLEALVEGLATTPFSYSAVGATAEVLPTTYWTDRAAVDLGTGHGVFARAKAVLADLSMFDNGVTELYPRTPRVKPGQVVLVQLRVLGLWSVNPCRVVYVVDTPEQFGFAYGTLPGHAEQGEEVFLVRRNSGGRVWFETNAFSRPQEWLVKLGNPYAKKLQQRVKQLYLDGFTKAMDL